MKEKNIITSIGMVGIYVLILLAESIAIYLLRASSNFIQNIFMVLFEFIVIFLVIKLVKPTLKKDFETFKKNWKEKLKTSFGIWFLSFLIMIISNVIIYYIVGDISENQQANEEILRLYPLYGIISCSIVAPICEELIFRYNFKTCLKKQTSFLIITSFIFGFMHVLLSSTSFIQLLYVIPYSILGLGLGYVYYKTNNIWSSIFIHMFHNSLALILIFLNF